jgi:hypothetical protein
MSRKRTAGCVVLIKSAASRPSRFKGLLLGRRQAIAGTPIDGPKAFYPGVISVGNENEARQAVRQVKESGADFIEVDGGLSREAYFAIAEKPTQEACGIVKL